MVIHKMSFHKGTIPYFKKSPGATIQSLRYNSSIPGFLGGYAGYLRICIRCSGGSVGFNLGTGVLTNETAV